jgi:hypothetical protein
MEEVLIVSKTHMSSAACVGGLSLANHRYLRLLSPGNSNQPIDTNFEVGQVWNLRYIKRDNIHPPHVEDVIILEKKFNRDFGDITEYIEANDLVDWTGHIDNLFNGLLHWTKSGSGYIPVDGPLPQQSVGFWIADRGLVRVEFGEKVKYRFPNGAIYRNISYVGYQTTVPQISKGTALRVSFSRLFPPDNSNIDQPKGYYLQLSGWY